MSKEDSFYIRGVPTDRLNGQMDSVINTEQCKYTIRYYAPVSRLYVYTQFNIDNSTIAQFDLGQSDRIKAQFIQPDDNEIEQTRQAIIDDMEEFGSIETSFVISGEVWMHNIMSSDFSGDHNTMDIVLPHVPVDGIFVVEKNSEGKLAYKEVTESVVQEIRNTQGQNK